MQEGHRFAVAAAVTDVCVGSIVLGAIYVLFSTAPIAASGALIAVVFLVVSAIIYHRWLAADASLLTPGEVVLGRKLWTVRARRVPVGGEAPTTIADKNWTNPYGIDRTLLFVVVFASLVAAGYSWCGVVDHNLYEMYTVPRVLLRIVLLFILLPSVMLLGSGVLRAGSAVVLYFAVSGLELLLFPLGSSGLRRTTLMIGTAHLGMTLLGTLVFLRYARNRMLLMSKEEMANLRIRRRLLYDCGPTEWQGFRHVVLLHRGQIASRAFLEHRISDEIRTSLTSWGSPQQLFELLSRNGVGTWFLAGWVGDVSMEICVVRFGGSELFNAMLDEIDIDVPALQGPVVVGFYPYEDPAKSVSWDEYVSLDPVREPDDWVFCVEVEVEEPDRFLITLRTNSDSCAQALETQLGRRDDR